MNQLPFEKIKREILIKREEEGEFGINPEERSLNKLLDYGIININKPKGPTSHQTSAFVQKILGIKKSGHSGTLDPAVTGVLPVALGKGTKVVTALINAGKEYVALMHLHDLHKTSDIKKVFKKMTGKIKQLPPVKSAIKRQ
ncbi:RNA-guided pseudouridylation complex pseudouridine synthase subunit Cbf5, partial [Candidatus Woesearchaeota archaeon]|nr:RNA-guided pseudouridylation complex pseudouridine synthase subunit Cbf5 [Candidatus Woesearchaeota archaeon]